MSWENIKLAEVNPGFDEIPEGRYNFALVGAAPGKFDPNEINVRVTIVSEGENQGRTVFVRFPDPEKVSFAPKALKRLEQSLGIDILPEEDGDGIAGKISYLNRAAKDGARFSGEMKKREWVSKTTGEKGSSVELQFFSVGPTN